MKTLYQKIKRIKIKISLFFIPILLPLSGLYGQKDTIIVKDYEWCIEWLEEMRPPILADTLGMYGAKWSAAERLLKEGCDFKGELFPIIEYYFGIPDEFFDKSLNPYLKDDGKTFRYLLFRPPGISTTGMKWLIVNCDKSYRIKEIKIFTVDE